MKLASATPNLFPSLVMLQGYFMNFPVSLFPSLSSSSSHSENKCIFCYSPLIKSNSRYCGNACRQGYFRRLRRSQFNQCIHQAFSLSGRIDNPALRILLRTVINDISRLSP